MPRVELICDRDCPHAAAARAALAQACALAGVPAHWREWDRADRSIPPHAAGFGSPTVLVDGVDVAGQGPTGPAKCCRVYRDEQGRPTGAPTARQIAEALLRVGGDSPVREE